MRTMRRDLFVSRLRPLGSIVLVVLGLVEPGGGCVSSMGKGLFVRVGA